MSKTLALSIADYQRTLWIAVLKPLSAITTLQWWSCDVLIKKIQINKKNNVTEDLPLLEHWLVKKRVKRHFGAEVASSVSFEKNDS